MPSRARKNNDSVNRRTPPWTRWSDERLLNVRLCDLGLKIGAGPLEPRIRRLRAELKERRLRISPHFWLSDEWFCPDGIPGVAIPFYLAHPRLEQLERRQMFYVEGASAVSCLRVLRHEVGHAVDHAYGLSRRRDWQNTFGRSSQPYPYVFHPDPYSVDFVHHLGGCYAQSHPDEDFAETFAVWLGSGSNWRRDHTGGAREKLEYVNDLMTGLVGIRPSVACRTQVEPISQIRITLRDLYSRRKATIREPSHEQYDRHLNRIFKSGSSDRSTAASFLRRNRASLRTAVAAATSEYPLVIDRVIMAMVGRCQALGLRLRTSQEFSWRASVALATTQVMNGIHKWGRRVSL